LDKAAVPSGITARTLLYAGSRAHKAIKNIIKKLRNSRFPISMEA
jgi:hypothetical protein